VILSKTTHALRVNYR